MWRQEWRFAEQMPQSKYHHNSVAHFRWFVNAFFKRIMQGVDGKNPISENAILAKVFDKTFNLTILRKTNIFRILSLHRGFHNSPSRPTANAIGHGKRSQLLTF